MRSVLHTTPHTYSNLSPRLLRLHIGMCLRRSSNGSFFQCTLGFIRAIAGQKLHLQFLRAILLFPFTHNSCVMSTICHCCIRLKKLCLIFRRQVSATLKLVVASVTKEDLKGSLNGSLAHFEQLPVGVSVAPTFFNGKNSSIFQLVLLHLM